MKIFRKLVVLILAINLAAIPAMAQQATSSPSAESFKSGAPKTVAELQQRIAELLDQPRFAPARWGVRIIAADGPQAGQVIFERDANKSFMPASNMKLYTSTAALETFGPDFRIRTSVYATRRPSRNGTLRGDLIFYGRGDPNLSPRFDEDNDDKYDELGPKDRITPIEELADRIKAAGIRTVTGSLIGDDSYFAGDLLGPGWEWDDAQFYYGAEISALTVNDNSVAITVTPATRAGRPPAINIQPQTKYLKIINRVKTADHGQTRIRVARPLGDNTVEIYGTISRGSNPFKVNVAVHDPAGFAATLLKEALARRKIRVLRPVRRIDARTRLEKPLHETRLIEIASYESQPMSEMLKVINKQSQNLHTELILRQLGKRFSPEKSTDDFGRPRSTAADGNEVRIQFLQKAGVDTQPLNLRDGSGLARQNLVTPYSTSKLLEFMLTHPETKTFRDSLTIAGIDGTLERRMRDTPAAGNARGKTGTLSGVNSLSGYVMTRNGRLIIFSMMGNNYTGPGRDVTGVLDRICVMLAEFDGEI